MAFLVLASAGVAACDVPTALPRWEQTWAVPGESIEITVAELLPDAVTLSADSSAFVTTAPGTSISVTLGQMCNCPGSAGFEVTKPEFSYTLNTSTTLPADLVSATLAGGSFDLALAHDFDFDPLNPSADPAEPKGSIAITVTSAGNVVADTTISGENTQWLAGVTLSPSLAIQPVAVTNDLQIDIEIFSPEGDATTFESSDSLGVSLEPSVLEIAEIEVAAGSITLDGTTTTMDFSGIEEDGFIVDRIQSGALVFDVQNPFSITGSLDITFQLPDGQNIQRSMPIMEGDYVARSTFSGDELRSILGSGEADVLTSGSVAGTAGTITITPRQALILDSRFEVVLLVGGMENE